MSRPWLGARPNSSGLALPRRLGVQERTLIEEALAATNGKVSGRAGAAARLKMSAATLELRIRPLGIDRNRFKTPY